MADNKLPFPSLSWSASAVGGRSTDVRCACGGGIFGGRGYYVIHLAYVITSGLRLILNADANEGLIKSW